MQKIRNRSNFFQKIFHIRYISKNFENSTAFLKKSATSGILPEFLKSLPLFWTFFQKSFSGRPGITISAISYAPIRQIRQNSLLPGLFPKSPSTVPFLSNFFKKFYLFTTAIAKTPRKGHTHSGLFSKNFHLLPRLYPKRHPVVLLLSEKIPKNIITTPLIISFLSPKRYTVFKKN